MRCGIQMHTAWNYLRVCCCLQHWSWPSRTLHPQVKAGELVAPVVAGAAQGALKAYCDCPVGGDASCVRDCGCTSKLDPQCNWLDLGDAINLGQLNGALLG